MRVHVLQHVPFEGLGSIAAWLRQKNASITWTRFFEASVLPSLDDLDLVIALGGPMSVNDEDLLPWLRAEKRFVADAIRADKAVLGICLGAQLIASALGASVYPGAHKEIGWFPVRAQRGGAGDFSFPESVLAFHWHGETFDLPANARLLASSDACHHQAFQVGERILALQFHLETTSESAAALIAHCGEELLAQRFVQTETQLRAVPASSYQSINALMSEVLEYLVRVEDFETPAATLPRAASGGEYGERPARQRRRRSGWRFR